MRIKVPRTGTLPVGRVKGGRSASLAPTTTTMIAEEEAKVVLCYNTVKDCHSADLAEGEKSFILFGRYKNLGGCDEFR